ncbi:MAG: M6 family metalloprotease domain-containing protein [bacterium]|nr:M6 family metalloprotease domain-containing protein [bacterium]
MTIPSARLLTPGLDLDGAALGATLAAVVLTVLAAGRAQAMPGNPAPVELTQPDGARITLQVRGDEFYHWFEDLEGYTVVRDAGQYVYAALDARGDLAATKLTVGQADPQSAGLTPGTLPTAQVRASHRATRLAQPAFRSGPPSLVPPAGTVKNLVILCKFSDHTFGQHTRAPADYDVLFNTVGGDPVLAPTGSVRDCYAENSYGIMTLDSTVVAWVSLPQTEAYYTNGQDGTGGYPQNAQGMCEDALNLVDALVDFGQFDTDNDGYIDSIDFLHSGYGAETGGGGGNWIWSHRWSLWALPGGEWTSSDLNGNGQPVRVYDYHTEPALWGTSGTDILRIGVIAHETGHFFGLPDLYDTNGGGEGVGSYCMMANSWGFDFTQWHPPHFSAWSKIFLGWASATVLTSPGVYAAPEVEFTPTVYRIDQGYPSGEYLLIENRQPVGLETVMPQGGLCIWHIDEAKTTNQDQGYPGQSGWPGNNNHYMVALLQADGNYDLERDVNRGDGGDVYHAGGVWAIDETTVPNTDAYQGGNIIVTNNSISNISAAGSSMTFQFGDQIPCTGDGDCDDGLFCNGAETCDSVLDCQAGSDPCPGQTCDEVNDVCVAPPTIVSGRTCMMHDMQRWCFDQDSGQPDPRLGPAQLELDLTGEVSSLSVSMSCASGHLGSPTASIGSGLNGPASRLTVDFEPLPNIDCCTVTLSGDAADQYDMSVLAGDVNGSGVVNATDKNLVKGNMGNAVDAFKFVFDVNASGVINGTDKNLTKGWTGTSAMPCP